MKRLPHIVGITLLLLCVQMPVLFAQSHGDVFDHDADVLVQDAADIFIAPGDFDSGDWLKVGGLVAIAAAAYTVDDDVRTWAQKWRTPEWDDLLAPGDWYGDGWWTSGLALGMYAGGLFSDDEWTRVTGRTLLQSQLYSMLAGQLIKLTVGRARPDMNEGKHSFNPFSLRNDYHSHPSGHSISSFAFSTTLSRRVGSVPFSVLLYALSGLTVLQRIEGDRHWLSDTIVGSVLGTVIGIAVVQAEERREQEKADRVPVTAGFSPHRPLYGISLSF